ncbi:peptidylprolyl isomerase [Angomonas deanei]|nr:peptidylprolyl isomerase [Angomonas deanei]EPY41273.1 peptidylprolyl isomerase [Angomonas deanei]EPY43694.1 peptidylprolyl isomerase [Angomonas deanei]|eukprot:EPY29057.1 peptidylprolyl isomerase [Angomonas deanei]
MEEALPSYMNELATLIKEHGTETSDSTVEELAAELAEYMKDCYGNCVRLDYGTGHELHFFIIIMICLQELGDTGGYLIHDDITSRNVVVPTSEPLPNAIAANEEITVKTTSKTVNKCKFLSQLRKQFCHFVFFQYIHFMRVLQKHYSLEPAGSHGVWGLDDYHHLPYILGASQLVGPTQTLQTKDICDKEKVYQNASNYYYFEMIEWILENKTGPFHEHSNMLYNISGVPRWEKTYSGMIKMYAAEVLSKFNVSQHLLFSKHLPWNSHKLE